MLRAMQAIAKITTSVALVIVRPPARSANGSTAHASAAMTTGERSSFTCGLRTALAPLLETLYPFAEEPARPEQQHEQHQQIHRRFGGRRQEVDGERAHGS